MEKNLAVLIDTLSKNKIESYFGVPKGFIPYQFEMGSSIDLNASIEDSKINEMLIVRHYEKRLKKGKINPLGLQSLLDNENLSNTEKEILDKFLTSNFYNIFNQDFIFIPGNDFTVVFPAKDRDDIIQYVLNPYFEDFFEFNLDPKGRKITQDVLEWLVWKVKRQDNGFVGQFLIMNGIEAYDSPARLNDGDHKIIVDGIEENLHAMVAMICDERCKGVKLSITYKGDKFCFGLFPEGSYNPVWGSVPRYDEDNRINKILVLKKISKEIIPYIHDQYIKDKPNWDSQKVQIVNDILTEVKNSF